jgi:hypothetical protein
VYIHGGLPTGVWHQLLSAFVRQRRQPTVAQMKAIYEALHSSLPMILHETLNCGHAVMEKLLTAEARA